MVGLYKLLPLIIRIRDAMSVEGTGITEGTLERVLDAFDQENSVMAAEIADLRKLIDAEHCDPKYLLYLSAAFGVPIGDEFPISFRRWFAQNLVGLHKIKATQLSIKKQWLWLSKRHLGSWELWKHKIYEEGDYSRYQDYTHLLRAARYDIYEGTPGDPHFYSVARAMPLDHLIRSVTPIHVLLRLGYREVMLDVLHGPDVGENVLLSARAEVAEGQDSPEDRGLTADYTVEETRTCGGGCESGCQTTCAAGCQGACASGCAASCTASCTGGSAQTIAELNELCQFGGSMGPLTEITHQILQGLVTGLSMKRETYLACVYNAEYGQSGSAPINFLGAHICYPLGVWNSAPAAGALWDAERSCVTTCEAMSQAIGAPPLRQTTGIANWLWWEQGVAGNHLKVYFQRAATLTGAPSDVYVAPTAFPPPPLTPAQKDTNRLAHYLHPPLIQGDYILVRYFDEVLVDHLDTHVQLGDGAAYFFQWAAGVLDQPAALASLRIEVWDGTTLIKLAVADILGYLRGNISGSSTLNHYDYTTRELRVYFDSPPPVGAEIRVYYHPYDANLCFWWWADVPHSQWMRWWGA